MVEATAHTMHWKWMQLLKLISRLTGSKLTTINNTGWQSKTNSMFSQPPLELAGPKHTRPPQLVLRAITCWLVQPLHRAPILSFSPTLETNLPSTRLILLLSKLMLTYSVSNSTELNSKLMSSRALPQLPVPESLLVNSLPPKPRETQAWRCTQLLLVKTLSQLPCL